MAKAWILTYGRFVTCYRQRGPGALLLSLLGLLEGQEARSVHESKAQPIGKGEVLLDLQHQNTHERREGVLDGEADVAGRRFRGRLTRGRAGEESSSFFLETFLGPPGYCLQRGGLPHE